MENHDNLTEKLWHVNTGDDSVMHIDAATLEQWIRDGAILPHHQVSRGGTRWMEAAKVPQFMSLFPQQSFVPPSPPPSRPKVQAYSNQPSYQPEPYMTPSTMKAEPPSTGLRIGAGAALSLVIAFAGAYLWAYQFSSPRDYNALKNEPKMVALQDKFDKDKAMIDEAQLNYRQPVQKTASVVPPSPRLGPARSQLNGKTDTAMAEWAASQMEAREVKLPDFGIDYAPRDFAGELTNLNGKFENDKAVAMAEIRKTDSKRRFFPAMAIIFFALTGLNIVRVKMSSK